MKSSKIAYRYAATLFKMAQSKESLKQDLNVILKAMQKTQLLDWLLAPHVSKSAKDQALRAIFTSADPRLINFLRYLVHNNRMNYFPEIVDMYDRLTEENSDALEIKVISAIPLTEEEKTRLMERFKKEYGKQTVLEEEVDPKIMGGLIVFMGNKMIDGSTRRRLVLLKEKLNEKNYAIKS